MCLCKHTWIHDSCSGTNQCLTTNERYSSITTLPRSIHRSTRARRHRLLCIATTTLVLCKALISHSEFGFLNRYHRPFLMAMCVCVRSNDDQCNMRRHNHIAKMGTKHPRKHCSCAMVWDLCNGSSENVFKPCCVCKQRPLYYFRQGVTHPCRSIPFVRKTTRQARSIAACCILLQQ